MNELLNELRKRKRSFVIQAIAAANHSQTLLNDLKVNGDSEEEDIFDNKVDGRTLPRPGRAQHFFGVRWCFNLKTPPHLKNTTSIKNDLRVEIGLFTCRSRYSFRSETETERKNFLGMKVTERILHEVVKRSKTLFV